MQNESLPPAAPHPAPPPHGHCAKVPAGSWLLQWPCCLPLLPFLLCLLRISLSRMVNCPKCSASPTCIVTQDSRGHLGGSSSEDSLGWPLWWAGDPAWAEWKLSDWKSQDRGWAGVVLLSPMGHTASVRLAWASFQVVWGDQRAARQDKLHTYELPTTVSLRKSRHMTNLRPRWRDGPEAWMQAGCAEAVLQTV